MASLGSGLGRPAWAPFLNNAKHGYLLDLPFKHTLAEGLWRGARSQSEDGPLRLQRLKRVIRTRLAPLPGLPALVDVKRLASERSQRTWGRGLYSRDHQGSDARRCRDSFSLPRRTLARASTSGTTGQPLTFTYSPSLRSAHQAAVAMALSYGLPDRLPEDVRFALIRGRPVRGYSATAPGGSLVLSSALRRSPRTLTRLLDAYRPEALYGLPSVIPYLVPALPKEFVFELAILGSESPLATQIQSAQTIAKKSSSPMV